MSLQHDNVDDIYELITELSKQILKTHRHKNESQWCCQKSDRKDIKRLRTKAYEILLSKTSVALKPPVLGNVEYVDPVIEILKYAFTLRVEKKQHVKAKHLEALLEEVSTDAVPESTIYSVLQLLVDLKSFNVESAPTLDIFHYGESNSLLPEVEEVTKNVPTFQVYPMEACILSEQFEAFLGIQSHNTEQYCIEYKPAHSISKLSFGHVTSPVDITNNTVSFEEVLSQMVSNTIACEPNLYLEYLNAIPDLSQQVMRGNANVDNHLCVLPQSVMTDAIQPWQQVKISEIDSESSDSCRSSDHDICDKSFYNDNDWSLWNHDYLQSGPVTNMHTWETHGELDSLQQPLFMTEVPNILQHLTRIAQASITVLLPEKVVDAVPLLEEISLTEFVSCVKSLLLGIESNCFKYKDMKGFYLKENVIVSGISTKSLLKISQNIIYWGNCFKFLSLFSEPDLHTGKLQQEGFIFKAMCTSIKEFLLHYQAALLRIFVNASQNNGLLQLLQKVLPVTCLITEVEAFYRYNNGSCSIEGSAILSRLYEAVTKITKPRVCLVFYSILKSCCDIYFRFLQKWLFEGVCDDVYGEFMIKVNSQYLRNRGHKFWTKAFTIYKSSVPKFLDGFAETIMQCGKVVKLLRICDPKNPVCRIFTSFQPELNVCLNVAMLHEQLSKCLEYEKRGETALGRIVSLASAIQDQKDIEKEKANYAIIAQQNTLLRLRRQQEAPGVKLSQSKQEFLKVLKQQALEAALRKEKAKEAEMIADKLLMKKILEEEQCRQDMECIDREKVSNYYKELDAEIQNRRLRSTWRIKRMDHFEERINVLSSITQNLNNRANIEPDSETPIDDSTNVKRNKDFEEHSENEVIPLGNVVCDVHSESESLINHHACQDENSNITGDNDAEDCESCEYKSHNSDQPVTSCILNNINYTSDSKYDITVNNDIRPADDTQYIKRAFDRSYPQQTMQKIPPFTSAKNIYKKNNERSTLQEFLLEEAAKKNSNQMVVNRPQFLKFKDTLTEAEGNKLKVLQQEYGMTPNNNEVNVMFTKREKNDNVNQSNENGNILNNPQRGLVDNLVNKNGRTSILQQITPSNYDIVNTLTAMHSEKCEGSKEDAIVSVTDNSAPLVSNAQLEFKAETPMSCTTDTFLASADSLPLHSQSCEITSPSDIGSEALTFSDAMKSCTEASPGFWQEKSTFPTELGFLSNVSTPAGKSSLSMTDVEMIDSTSFQVYLEKSITTPLRIQSRLANNAIIKYLLEEHNMLLHFHSLRSYFFLLNGEFAKTLTDSLYGRLYEISVPIELFNSATLTNLLEKALINSFSGNYVNSELLSLSAVDTPFQLHISDPAVLDCLYLNYKISWPFNIILDDMVMSQYSKVFKFLIMIGRVSWVLQEDFNLLKTERKITLSNQYHKVQLYRHSMMQFMNALRNYLTCSVLHASWTEFEKDLQNSLTLDQVYISHVTYIKKILSRCMLNIRGEKMRTCLKDVFKVILKFHNRLRSQRWAVGSTGLIHPNFKRLEQMYKTFCELRTYLAHIASKLATSGYQPHLTHFLNALNINSMYDLTVKAH